jgi:hypothetical protein
MVMIFSLVGILFFLFRTVVVLSFLIYNRKISLFDNNFFEKYSVIVMIVELLSTIFSYFKSAFLLTAPPLLTFVKLYAFSVPFLKNVTVASFLIIFIDLLLIGSYFVLIDVLRPLYKVLVSSWFIINLIVALLGLL